jgi:alkaline phosphatase
MISRLDEFSKSLSTTLPTFIMSGITNAVSSIGTFVIGMVIGFYLLLSCNNLGNNIMDFIPRRFRKGIRKLTKNINQALRNYVNGALIDAFVVFVVSSLAFALIGLKGPLLFGLFCGMMNVIPYAGPYIGGAPAVIVGFSQGLGVGIVTTDLLSGATPSAFSAHALKRSQTDQIIKTQLENKIDLYIGAGNETYSLYKTEWESKGYTFVQTYDELLNTKQEGKIIASFKSLGHTPSDDEATLSLVFEYAIEYFEKNFPNGYFLMVEGAHIDKMNHSNKVEEMIYYLNDFDKTIKLAYDRFYNDPDFCMIITADHESGGLKLADSKAQITNDLYTTDGHTAKNVRYFIYQKGNDDINKIPNIIDNTSVFKINKNLLNL